MPHKEDITDNDAESAKTAPEVSGKLLNKVDKDVGSVNIPVKRRKSAAGPTLTPDNATPKAPTDPIADDDPLDDEATDDAVTDIAAKEGNTLLALQDAIGDKATRVAGDLAEQDRRKASHRHWAWLIFFVVVIVIILLALPLNSHTCHWPVGIRLRVTTDILPSVCK
ncbi:MAG TPA: hypothetical protein VHA05_02100 [Candidatus Saccharimonadales bacterium]|nr:hypothetical protein [Candidatus Saccharimonadales bacterium]